MPFDYPNTDLLHEDNFQNFDNWHHEGKGEIKEAEGGGLRLHCYGSRQGAEGCMAFFRPNLPDQIAVEYDVTVRSHGGLLINYLGIRGLNREDLITDSSLPERTGIMANYYHRRWGLQSYHISFSRFNDAGEHTNTSNWRRNPGCLLAGHGNDPCKEINRQYHIRLTKDAGHCQFYCDGEFAHGFIDRDVLRFPIPDHGKFGFRTIGSDVMVDIQNFRIYKIAPCPQAWTFSGIY